MNLPGTLVILTMILTLGCGVYRGVKACNGGRQ